MKSVRRYERCHRILRATGLRRLLKVNRVYLSTYICIYLYFVLESWACMRFVYLLINIYGGQAWKAHNFPSEKTFFFLRSRELDTNKPPDTRQLTDILKYKPTYVHFKYATLFLFFFVCGRKRQRKLGIRIICLENEVKGWFCFFFSR